MPPLLPFREAEQLLRIMAHQGWQGRGLPNSLMAISESFGAAEAVEFDVYAIPHAGDPARVEIVAHHPEGYFLFVDKRGMKNTDQLPLSFEQAQKIEVQGQPLIPSLDEIVEAYGSRTRLTGRRTEMQIELKGPNTAEAVVPALQKHIAEGRLSYADFALTGLCYPGDRSRLETPRILDPNVRLVFVLRGGDLKQDGFADYDEVIEFGTRIRAETVTLTRRTLTPEVVAKLKDAGFMVGCYHSRTSDELEAALALGADYVAADFFKGSRFSDYPGVRPYGSPLFNDLHGLGFYALRDWIWELGWACEAARDQLPEAHVSLALPIMSSERADSTLIQTDDGTIAMRLFGAAAGARIINFSDFPLPSANIAPYDQVIVGTPHGNIGHFLSEEGQTAAYRRGWEALMAKRSSDQTAVADRLVATMNTSDIAAAADGRVATVLRRTDSDLTTRTMTTLEEYSREFMCRSGRLVGMLAFTALNPRHATSNAFNAEAFSDVCRLSSVARIAAEEQFQAQLLRSGKTATLSFG